MKTNLVCAMQPHVRQRRCCTVMVLAFSSHTRIRGEDLLMIDVRVAVYVCICVRVFVYVCIYMRVSVCIGICESVCSNSFVLECLSV